MKCFLQQCKAIERETVTLHDDIAWAWEQNQVKNNILKMEWKLKGL